MEGSPGKKVEVTEFIERRTAEPEKELK